MCMQRQQVQPDIERFDETHASQTRLTQLLGWASTRDHMPMQMQRQQPMPLTEAFDHPVPLTISSNRIMPMSQIPDEAPTDPRLNNKRVPLTMADQHECSDAVEVSGALQKYTESRPPFPPQQESANVASPNALQTESHSQPIPMMMQMQMPMHLIDNVDMAFVAEEPEPTEGTVVDRTTKYHEDPLPMMMQMPIDSASRHDTVSAPEDVDPTGFDRSEERAELAQLFGEDVASRAAYLSSEAPQTMPMLLYANRALKEVTNAKSA